MTINRPIMEETMSQNSHSDDIAERITVLANDFTPAAMEYHRRKMGKRGYVVEGPIRCQTFLLIDGPGEPESVLGGKPYYAITFVRRSCKAAELLPHLPRSVST